MVFYDTPGNRADAGADDGEDEGPQDDANAFTGGVVVDDGGDMEAPSGDDTHHEPVDEVYEAARSRQRPVDDVSQAAPASPAITTPGGRGPSVTCNALRAPQAPAPPVDAALAARLRAREQEIVDLNIRLRNAEARRTPSHAQPVADASAGPAPSTRRAAQRSDAAPTVAQPAAEDGPAVPRTPFVARVLARETSSHCRDKAPTPALLLWAERLEKANLVIPGFDNGMKLHVWHRENGLPFATAIFERSIYASFRRPFPPQLVLCTYAVVFWLYGVEYPLINGSQMPRSAPQNAEDVRWYLDRVNSWAREAIRNQGAVIGPWWDAAHRAWAFRRGSNVLISEDGFEDLSPTMPPNVPAQGPGDDDGDA
ncbi:unnamed protein product [Closterium sp. NIES-65]|nr:unnamed protein product [Closterium sp. NIES-65]